jgi:hypothetical protein
MFHTVKKTRAKDEHWVQIAPVDLVVTLKSHQEYLFSFLHLSEILEAF